MNLLNIAFYRFASLENPEQWKDRIETAYSKLDIKGTMLIAEEGLNGFLAGPESAVRSAIDFLQKQKEFKNLTIKESRSNFIPFERLSIKVKSEIVTFRVPGCGPLLHATQRIPPEELAKWYERGEEFTVLDTRNEYEFRLGKFAKAESLQINQFVEFPEKARKLPESWKKRKIVTYCTGGIRCEKAAPFLEALGFEEVYQLDGGVLNYFEKVGSKNWEGECFVFDQRVALDSNLSATGASLCSKCQGPIPKGASCPHCGA
jgi:UPF0176 protein